MAFADFASTRPGVSVTVPSIVRSIKGWLAARHAARRQHLALQTLLFLPEYRLNDMGIRRDEVIRVMEIHRK